MKFLFIHLLLVLISVAEVVAVLMIHMLKYAFQTEQKNLNVKVFHLMSGVNETRFLVQRESCDCKCTLNESAKKWNSKQKWNHNECWCECKELDDWSSCKDHYLWNPSTCDCECSKIDEYLDCETHNR